MHIGDTSEYTPSSDRYPNLVPKVSHLTARPRGGKMRDPGKEIVSVPPVTKPY